MCRVVPLSIVTAPPITLEPVATTVPATTSAEPVPEKVFGVFTEPE